MLLFLFIYFGSRGGKIIVIILDQAQTKLQLQEESN